MKQTDALDLAAMMCSRLCHDLLSPVGALSNGLELLVDEKDPEMRQRCFELLEQSAKISTDKLRFFRLAFGAAGGYGDMVKTEEPRQLTQALLGDSGRVKLNWQVGPARLSKPVVKVLLNFAQLGIEALARGGELDIGLEERGGTTEIVVRATGTKIAFDETIGRALEGRLAADELTSRTAAAHMLHLLAEEGDGRLQFHRDEGTLILGAELPLTSELIG